MRFRLVSSVVYVVTACGGASPSTPDARMADAPPDASADPVAGTLAGLRWEMPCVGDYNEGNCTVTDPAPVVATLGGTPGMIYQVTLRFRGVVETKTYEGGTTAGYFNTGGAGVADGFNVYKLEVAAPAQSYFLNAGISGIGNAFGIDYTATLSIAAGATVTLTASAIDGVQHKNLDETSTPIVIPDIAPAPAAYDGQFVQMDVVSVRDAR